MSDPAFTILLPVVRPPDLLEFAVASVLGQTRQDFELLIICDGAPPETAAAAEAFQARDARVRANVHPKGERNGETWRHLALQGARGAMVCQIGDDDLWFPDHLEQVDQLLAGADFGHTLQALVDAAGRTGVRFGDLADARTRQMMLQSKFNTFGPTVAAYRREAYDALPVGWSPAPADLYSDLHMWRKFLVQPNLRFATRFAVTSVTFPQAYRQDWSLERRREEIRGYAERLTDADFRDAFIQRAFAVAARVNLDLRLEASRLRAGPSGS